MSDESPKPGSLPGGQPWGGETAPQASCVLRWQTVDSTIYEPESSVNNPMFGISFSCGCWLIKTNENILLLENKMFCHFLKSWQTFI